MIATPLRSPWKPWLLRGSIAGGVLGTVVLALLTYMGTFGSNLREVSAGRCYRSAQLKPETFAQVIADKQIKSVVNLRGASARSEWYQGELAACQRAQVEHSDFDIGLGHLPKPEAVKALVEKLETGPYPLLMHCRAGADRSSLGAVLYLNLVEKVPLTEAENAQMTWRYGHLPIGEARFINEFFRLYHETAGGKPLKDWIETDYPALYAKYLP